MKKVLPIIVLAQLSCTSVWFAVNAILPSIAAGFGLDAGYLAHLSSAVLFGFITGTLLFAIFGIADRISPSKVFFTSALIASLLNLTILLPGIHGPGLLVLRLMTGFFLAGIYPVGMKIAADHYATGLGKSLGFLVGALVLGTSFPHLLQSFAGSLPWEDIIYITSGLSLAGGIAMLLLVPDGPYRQPAQKFNPAAFWSGFRNKKFRAAALGYFGHMWELYAFWVFVPVMLTTYKDLHPSAAFEVPLFSFLIIASGGLGCVISGLIAAKLGTKKIAAIALSVSGVCCLLSPVFLTSSSPALLILFLFVWGISVIADSPLFSTMVAQNAAATLRGSSLTIVNCIGFSITIVSIQLTNVFKDWLHPACVYMFLAIGPALGLWALMREKED
ncbi:MAG: MFS transporter [Citrobacter freundii]|nr:MAG: MFS transporter [Citrobacter freundii]